ncbi:hypothetical protein Kpol_1020p6 [Vanderwaltozyma polyspora DSM 70294]|uniref:Uncharacterized protein n=1 Tax=Vanderwaltozyma polyspora (strain ATCC 22028 / DSM 70294 / BCRC 21397 / CBS 2163 / NBRC 10782 / NRRL Y-8283 / UCD 57-17) TaxID=436907 RepID=A7TLB9_VANPO|nr:uncharacterized protein Kpol_1020p6 [Vanderwaltozyma polyspora DSM 70294]EDO16900.1 hypothetical protein Kpol_1020p6 [Vanderwaltozyma polyspora DSM 70294]
MGRRKTRNNASLTEKSTGSNNVRFTDNKTVTTNTTTATTTGNKVTKKRKQVPYHLVTPEEPNYTLNRLGSSQLYANNDTTNTNTTNTNPNVNASANASATTTATTTNLNGSMKNTKELEFAILSVLNNLKSIEKESKNKNKNLTEINIDSLLFQQIIQVLNSSLNSIAHWSLQAQLSNLKNISANQPLTNQPVPNNNRIINATDEDNNNLKLPNLNLNPSKSLDIQNLISNSPSPSTNSPLPSINSIHTTPKKSTLRSLNDNLLLLEKASISNTNIKDNDISHQQKLPTTPPFTNRIMNQPTKLNEISSANISSSTNITSTVASNAKSNSKVSVSTDNKKQATSPATTTQASNVVSTSAPYSLKLVENNKPHPRMRRTGDNPSTSEFIRVFHLQKDYGV